ncbi:acyltransferase [Planotetraspora kaengkrachanensis]|uniref:Acyltransferase n=2 Tax=Planotetraspora kaengkrachanensis TaxID=575193 RepID=A0A8J3PUA5_9ACTN|nr:acyltransferase [Planotetraspora kaengkrachanensis]
MLKEDGMFRVRQGPETPASPDAPPVAGGPAKGPRLLELDALRFVAAFAVVSFHFMAASRSLWGVWPAHDVFPAVGRVTTLGILGVELFFLISGFVILMSAWGRTIGEFAISRVSRLYPTYWYAIIVIFVLYRFSGVDVFDPHLTAGKYLVNLTLLQEAFGVGHASGVLWSLWAELRFYALVAVFSLFGITARRCLVFMSVWIVFAVVAEITKSDVLTFVFMPRQAPYFIAGMAFYLIYRFRSVAAWAFVAVTYGMSIYAALLRIQDRVDALSLKYFPAPPAAVVVAVTLIFTLLAAVALGWLRWLRWRPLVTIGALTYPLYLLHQSVSAVLIPTYRREMNHWLLVAITMAVSIAIAYLVYRLVDKPGQKWLRARLSGIFLSRARKNAPQPS